MIDVPESSAVWRQYSTDPEKWALLLNPEHPVKRAVALVTKMEDGKWFAEHYPYMGEWCVVSTFEEAKQWSGCPWKRLWQNLPNPAAQK